MLLSSGGNWRLLAAFGVFSFLALSLAHSGRPAMFDEWYWLWGAKGILSEGVPVFYNDSGTPRFEGTGHPPLYTYLVAFTAWATSDYQKTKLLGIAFFLGTLFLTFKTAKIVFGERTAWISASLLSLAPFSVVGSTLIDPDTTTLPFFLSLFAFYYTKSINEKHPQTNLLSASLTLVFWSKFQGILFPLSSLAFHALRNDKTGVKRSFYLLAAGAALFFFTWTVFSSFTGLNFYCPFQHNSPFKMGCPSETLGGSGLFSFSDSKALPALGVARSLAFWLSPFFFLFFFAALRSNLTGFSKVNEKTGVIASYSLLGLLFVLLAGVGFSGLPKYFFSVLPF
ncbi:MAG TPA: glycosyltransferase family 39 protein, partial [archaeon]|nr:glycosyltransferase family 39 protein [archaeon]